MSNDITLHTGFAIVHHQIGQIHIWNKVTEKGEVKRSHN